MEPSDFSLQTPCRFRLPTTKLPVGSVPMFNTSGWQHAILSHGHGLVHGRQCVTARLHALEIEFRRAADGLRCRHSFAELLSALLRYSILESECRLLSYSRHVSVVSRDKSQYRSWIVWKRCHSCSHIMFSTNATFNQLPIQWNAACPWHMWERHY
jgi:hypothetical protein